MSPIEVPNVEGLTVSEALAVLKSVGCAARIYTPEQYERLLRKQWVRMFGSGKALPPTPGASGAETEANHE